MKHNTHLAVGLFGATLMAAAMSACAPITNTAAEQTCDPVAAKGLVAKDHCQACHSATKQKGGPSFKSVAQKYADKPEPDAEAELYKHLTSAEVTRMADGNTGYHKCIATEKPEKIRNMVRWILVQ